MKEDPKIILSVEGEVTMEKVVTRYETNLSENYLPNWNELLVVKEFLQNLVYAKSILGDDVSISHDGRYAVISNSPSGFSKGKLLVGESNQRGVVGTPGCFGEGFKIGILVAKRLGMDVIVETNGFTVLSELEPSSIDPTVRCLVFYVEDTDKSEGTMFKVECTKEILEEAKTYFAILQGIDPEVTRKDTILYDYKGVYANGVKITDTPAIYGYNFTDTGLINRDRSTVDFNKLKTHVSSTLSNIEDYEVAVEVLQNISEDDGLLESQSGVPAWGLKASNIWKRASEFLFGKKVALATGGESDTKARYHKFSILTNIPQAWKYFFHNTLDIQDSNMLMELVDRPSNVHKKASTEENQTLGWAKMIISRFYSKCGVVKVSEKVFDQFGNECLGLYDRKADIIWLKRSLLSSKEETFKTLLHEMIHRTTGASDNSAEFTRGWEHATWCILNKGKVQ